MTCTGLFGWVVEGGMGRRPSKPITVALTLAEVPPTPALPLLLAGAENVPAKDGEAVVVEGAVVLGGG